MQERRGANTPGADDPEGAEGALARIVGGACGGDRGAFASLIRIFRPEVQRIALRLIGNHEDAEDVAQETFVRAWGQLGRFAEGHGSAEVAAERLGAWLVGISVHIVRDLQRKKSRAPRREAAAVAMQLAYRIAARRSDEPDAVVSERETQQLLNAALAALPERLRTALVLRTFEGLDYAAIAEITGLRANTVRTHVMQGRRALRRILGPALELDGEEEIR
ncbi:ECF RNA polymerase sigma factor SigW [Planctomycetes bacterium Poly30]|uniref:ECF RNA polymerase sigma factor SigW n=2 Tax=Saltatorellus ferox TaxID=2528018 RepID=A0A518EV48_9BACT|nr:ECF RNA polymerase sigma factor SigW [Planctomycetes bacterium Poly30]